MSKKKKITLAPFPEKTLTKNPGRKRVYPKGLTSHERRIAKIKEVSGKAWWVRAYLMDSCGLAKSHKFIKDKA